jgi:hypothetical protein
MRSEVGGCECADHKVHYERERALAVSLQVTIRVDSSDGSQQQAFLAELSGVYRHYFGRIDADDDDIDDECMLNCPFARSRRG